MQKLTGIAAFLYVHASLFRKFFWGGGLTLAVVLAVLFVDMEEPYTAPVGWEADRYITPRTLSIKGLRSRSRGPVVTLVYEGIEGTATAIYVSISVDGGGSFFNPVKVADVSGKIGHAPDCAISPDGTLVVSWHEYDQENASNRIFWSVSDDTGVTWREPKRLATGFETEMLPRIYFDRDGLMHFFFNAFHEGAFNLFYTRLDSEGVLSQTERLIELDSSMLGAFFPAIGLRDDHIYLVWQGKGRSFSDDLYFMQSKNSGRSWSSPERITQSRSSDSSPWLYISGETLYVVYQNNENKNWAVQFIRGYEGGRDWDEQPVTVSTTNADCYMPHLAGDDENLRFFWYDTREGKSNIYSRTWDLRRNQFIEEKEIKLSQRRYAATAPAVIAQGNRLFLLWQEAGRIVQKERDIYVTPPAVRSTSHPEEGWSRSSVGRMYWQAPQDASGIEGYATIVNEIPDFNPTIQNQGETVTAVVVPQLDDGVTWFHIRAIDKAGNFSRTIHYPLRTSINPLPAPVVISPTHPQGKSSDLNEGTVQWAIDGGERLKGFMYSLSRDRYTPPDTFITDFKFNFSDLSQGLYFFSIAAVDQTNVKSKVETYTFAVGEAKRVDPEYYKQLARDETKSEPDRRKPRWRVLSPSVNVALPFEETLQGREFKGIIDVAHLPVSLVEGYAVFLQRKEMSAPLRITQKDRIIHARDITPGTWYLSVRARYKGPGGTEQWTDAWVRKIDVTAGSPQGPAPRFLAFIANRMQHRFYAAPFMLLALIGMVAISGSMNLMLRGKIFLYRLTRHF